MMRCVGGKRLLPLVTLIIGSGWLQAQTQIGAEVSVPVHSQDGQEFTTALKQLLKFGKSLFTANWTVEEGGGRPETKRTGAGLSDHGSPLVFPRNFNRISAPDMNSCAGCHNKPVVGGGGEFGTLVFVLGQLPASKSAYLANVVTVTYS